MKAYFLILFYIIFGCPPPHLTHSRNQTVQLPCAVWSLLRPVCSPRPSPEPVYLPCVTYKAGHMIKLKSLTPSTSVASFLSPPRLTGISGDKVEIDPVTNQKASTKFWIKQKPISIDSDLLCACDLAEEKSPSE